MSDSAGTPPDHDSGKSRMRAGIVASTVLFAVARGVTMEAITAATGLTRADLVDPDAWLPHDIVARVWRLLGEAFSGQAIALEMARAAPRSFFGRSSTPQLR